MEDEIKDNESMSGMQCHISKAHKGQNDNNEKNIITTRKNSRDV